MYLNNSIIFELKLNNSFNQIIIEKNKITKCDDNKVKQDIENKLSKIKNNIEYVEFFVSLYDYKIINPDEYWETIKNLDKNYLPIYRKNNDFEEFILWLEKNFNNNDIRTYETSKFTKRRTNFSSNEKALCLDSVKWTQTNPKYKKFNQIFFHAGDFDDIERYGYLYVRTIYSKEKKIEITKKNVFYSDNQKIWDKFYTDFESIKNTMFYMFEKMKKGILIGIKNNKLAIFLPFSKNNYTNDFYTELYFDDNDKKNLEQYEKNPNNFLKQKLENTLKYYLNKYKLSNKNIILDRTKWVANDCFFRYEDYEGDKSEALYEDFFVNLCKNREISDCVFFLNLRDHPMLNKNLKDSYNDIIDRKLDKKYIFDKYAPILSQGGSIETADICICTQDDWYRVSKKIYPDDCKNGYISTIEPCDWDKKINKAVFRGSATGCKMDLDNVRIKASTLSLKYPEYLNAGITTFNRKLKKNIGKPLTIIDTNLQKANFMDLQEKSSYKYILNLDGHVSAFRLGHEFSLGSVLLIPKSKYYLWFSHLLEPFVHYVPIKENLDDLIEQIKWCIDNDDKCKEIASNGMKFYKKYLETDGIYDYMQNILNKIALKPLGLKKYKEHIAIITIYRNKSDNKRLEQKRLFIYWMNKMLSQICNYDIIIVEQSKDYQFNIGKLKNIGFDYLKKNTKKEYSNIIFTDIDTIPDSNLIDYFFKQTDSLNTLSMYGTRYKNDSEGHSRPFAGALLSCSSKIFEELNGYPNNFYGWGSEDENLLLRLADIKKPLYINSIGKIIDIEEIGGSKKNVDTKISELNKNEERETNVYEKNINWKNYKSNGLSNLNYKILYENKSKYLDSLNYHIIVDLEYDKDKKKYPDDYVFTQTYNKDFYRKFINDILYNIKQIKF